MTNGKNMKQLVAAIERGEGDDKKTFWTRVGVAFENRDPTIRSEIKAIVANDNATPRSTSETEPLIDAHAAGKLLGMSAAAVRAAAFRGTIPSHHLGRLLRFRASELLPRQR